MSKRWWIAAMLATATAINYLDRQNLPVAISEIQKAIPISDTQYSQLQFLFLLGLGEGGGFPGSAKAVAEWFKAEERAFAFGLFNTGSSLGAVIAPPLIAAIATSLGWRWVFLITGGLGFAWAALWATIYRTPARSFGAKASPQLK